MSSCYNVENKKNSELLVSRTAIKKKFDAICIKIYKELSLSRKEDINSTVLLASNLDVNNKNNSDSQLCTDIDIEQ